MDRGYRPVPVPPAAIAPSPAQAPADIVVAAAIGTDPSIYEGTGATWVLVTGWLDELHAAARTPPP